MRRLLLLCALCACASRSRGSVPAFIELESEHFRLRTDLSEPEGRETIAQLELVRAALISASWHNAHPFPGRLQVVQLQGKRELEEFAAPGIDGFVAVDAFGERLLAMSAEQSPEEQTVLKHEMAHVISNEFLVRNPRWVAEGIACYLETLKVDRAAKKVYIGDPGPQRLAWVRKHPHIDVANVFATGSEAMQLSAEAGFAYESSAWAMVHFLANRHRLAFDSFLRRLAKAEDPRKAFHADFPDLDDAKLSAQVAEYVQGLAQYLRSSIDQPEINRTAVVRRLARSEVHALRADLLRIGPGLARNSDRDASRLSEIALALDEDPGDPLALQLSGSGDAATATRVHPDDWRAWVLVADRNQGDASAIARAAKLSPDNPTILSRLAWAESFAGQRKKAIEHARRANELMPGHSAHLDTLASLLAGSGRCGEAVLLEQRAVDVLPDTAPPTAISELRARLGQIEQKCGKAPSRVEMADEDPVDTQPVRKSCGAPPSLDELPRGPLTAEYTVREDGSVIDVTLSGKASAGTLRAFREFVRTCSYAPATRAGRPVATRLRQDLSFSSAAGR
jgi:tetratricopeptide (TPR) repeat protein